jgi:hypothetical protein
VKILYSTRARATLQHVQPGDKTWNAVRAEIASILRSRAMLKKTIAYSELSSLLRTAPVPYDSVEMATLLREVSTEENAAGRGMLSVIVVHKSGDQMPGPGFFTLAAELGRDVSDPLKCWIEEIYRVYASNGPSIRTPSVPKKARAKRPRARVPRRSTRSR